MSSSFASTSAAPLRVAVPPLVVSAGAGGAALTIHLLRPTALSLVGGHALVLHDPVGLTGDRLLAHVYRTAAHHVDPLLDPSDTPPAGPEGSAASLVTLRWLLVRAPLSAVWRTVDQLPDRAWRVAAQRASRRESRRVAEPPYPEPLARRHPNRATIPQAALLLLSESERVDALSTTAAARIVARALRRRWSMLAVTRQGPVRRHIVSEAAAVPGTPRHAEPWRTHLVVQAGALVPLPPEIPPSGEQRTGAWLD
jgi:hypothetical protein